MYTFSANSNAIHTMKIRNLFEQGGPRTGARTDATYRAQNLRCNKGRDTNPNVFQTQRSSFNESYSDD